MEQEVVRDASPSYLVETGTASAEDVPPGYKRTEVGMIPEGWGLRPLREVAEVRTGIAKNTKLVVADPIAVHYLRVANVQDGFLDLSEMKRITISKTDLNRYRVLPGDVLMNEGGDLDKLGRGALWNGALDPCVHQNHVFVVRCKNSLEPEFLAAWSSADVGRSYFLVAGKQTTNLASINKTALGGLPVAVPAKEEQRAISTALSEVDALIESLDRLIAKKRAIKQAAMQQLLTGQTRLPGFTGEWETKRLGEVAEIDPENLGSNTPADYTFSYISLEQVEEGALLGWSTEKFRTAPSRARRVLREGDILVSTVRPNLKSHLKFGGQFLHAVCSTGFAVVRCAQDLADPGYIYAHLFGSLINRQIDRIIAGSNYPAISSSDVRKLELPLPRLEEQSAIATVLSDMDAEIEALEHRRDKARQIKQGMMQQLLTGRVRLVEPASKEASAC